MINNHSKTIVCQSPWMPCCHLKIQTGNIIACADNIACITHETLERQLFKFSLRIWQIFLKNIYSEFSIQPIQLFLYS